jgi:hypothetical protein
MTLCIEAAPFAALRRILEGADLGALVDRFLAEKRDEIAGATTRRDQLLAQKAGAQARKANLMEAIEAKGWDPDFAARIDQLKIDVDAIDRALARMDAETSRLPERRTLIEGLRRFARQVPAALDTVEPAVVREIFTLTIKSFTLDPDTGHADLVFALPVGPDNGRLAKASEAGGPQKAKRPEWPSPTHPRGFVSKVGAGGGIRTRKALRPAVFETATYTVPSPRRKQQRHGKQRE